MKTRKPYEPVMCLQCGVPMVMTPNGHWACPTTIEAKRMLELAITNPVDRAAADALLGTGLGIVELSYVNPDDIVDALRYGSHVSMERDAHDAEKG